MSDRKRICMRQFKEATKAPSENFKFVMSEQDVGIWYVLIHNFSGNKDEYKGGEYLARLELPDDFPYGPLRFYLLTPNGVYTPNEKVCISIGEFHPGDYQAVLGVDGFCAQLLSGLIGWKELGGGINITLTNTDVKRKYASESIAYNAKNNADVVKMINTAYDEYSLEWKKEKATPIAKPAARSAVRSAVRTRPTVVSNPDVIPEEPPKNALSEPPSATPTDTPTATPIFRSGIVRITNLDAGEITPAMATEVLGEFKSSAEKPTDQ